MSKCDALLHSVAAVWFVLLTIALSVVLVGGLYFRRRFLQALERVGVGPRALRGCGLLVPYLLFAYPLMLFAYVAVSLALGGESVSIASAGAIKWLVAYPFWISVLTMLQALPFVLLFDLVNVAASPRIAKPTRHRYRALATLLVVGFFGIYTPARIVIARTVLDVHHFEVGVGRGAPLRIVFMGDLQRDADTDEARSNEVMALVNEQEPDLILVGGDWINTGSEYITAAAQAGGQLQARLGVLSVRGDHEHFAFRDQDRSVRELSAALGMQGVEMLDNQVRQFEHEGKSIGVAFLSYNYIFHSSDDEVMRLLTELGSFDFSILLTHQFDARVAALVKDKVDLVLAAHTHGGQVNPVVGLWHVPLARVETRFVEGRYLLGTRTSVIVTAGIGFSIAPFRYASPASIEVIELRP